MSEQVIAVNGLTKRYGTFEALKDVNFTVNKGDVFGFLGPNGAGKSTTLRCMLSLIRPDKGSIRVFGKSLEHHRNEILSKTGCIIEKPDFYKYLSAYKNLEIFSRLSGAGTNRKKIFAMLDFVGLAGRENDKVAGYSHGMKQRLGLAQTLLHNPDLIILDEPATGLDPQGIIDIRNLILRLRDEQQKTVLLSSHNLSEIEIISNRMVIINKGRTIVEGDVAALLNSEELVVQVEVDQVAQARNILASQAPEAPFTPVDDTHFQITVSKQAVARINKILNDNGIAVYSIESRRKLEDYFIKSVNE